MIVPHGVIAMAHDIAARNRNDAVNLKVAIPNSAATALSAPEFIRTNGRPILGMNRLFSVILSLLAVPKIDSTNALVTSINLVSKAIGNAILPNTGSCRPMR